MHADGGSDDDTGVRVLGMGVLKKPNDFVLVKDIS